MIDFSVHMPTVGPTGYDYPQKMQALLDDLQVIGNMFDFSGNYSGGSVAASTFSASGTITSTKDGAILRHSLASTLGQNLAIENTGGNLVWGVEGSPIGLVTGATAYDGFVSTKVGTGYVVAVNYVAVTRTTSAGHVITGTQTINTTGNAIATFNSSHASGGYLAIQNSGATQHYVGNAEALTSVGGVNLALRSSGSIQICPGGATVKATHSTAGFTQLDGTIDVTAPNSSAQAVIARNAAASYFFLTGGGSQTVSTGWNAANTSFFVSKDSTTSRSVNAAGTINASGADYAEYETKADGCGDVVKGQIIGFDSGGKVTDKWADAIRFGVKSTNPNLVGGDSWGAEETVGARPVRPIYGAPAYAGPARPEEPAPMRAQPVQAEIVFPPEPSAPPEPTRGSMTDVEWARAVNAYIISDMSYRVAVAIREKAIAAQAAAEQAHAEALAAWMTEKEQHDAAVAQYEADLATWQAAQVDHAAAVRAAQEAHAADVAQYDTDLAAFEVVLEAARVKVDRIAYSGKCPVNVTGTAVGDYIVPMQAGDGIAGVAVAAAAITFDQYRVAIGQVQRILDDGRAEIVVKPI